MAYKDKDKQREANRERQRRHRRALAMNDAVQGLIAKGVTNKGVTVNGSDNLVTPKRGKDIKCFEDLPVDVQETILKMSTVDGKLDESEKAKRTLVAINYQRLFPGRYYPVSTYHCPQDAAVTGKPGDADYNGICTEEWRAERGR